MNADNTREPLINEPAREATAALRGYWAQIWRSVEVWVKLKQKERLYLEGAEDFDLVRATTAEVVQVKDKARKITLQSDDVVAAINNAWGHYQRNPKQQIRFRYLTTAGIGVEKGAPFGKGVGGLHLWQNCRLSRDAVQRKRDARRISNFLVSKGKLSGAVKAFLQTSSDEDAWKSLIVPIEWDTDAKRAPDIIKEIKDQLVILGQKLKVPADKAEEVAEHLYAFAHETATREKERCLSRADLLRLFNSRTRVSLPAGTVDALFAAIPTQARSDQIAQSLAASLALQQQQAIRQLVADNEGLLDRCIKLVNENIVEFIRENTGEMGKMAAADFWDAPRQGFYVVVSWFFVDQSAPGRQKGRSALLDAFGVREIRRDFKYAQWIRLDSINNMMSDVLKRLREMRDEAQRIDALHLYLKWSGSHPTNWYEDAMEVMNIVKPRVDQIRATWDDFGAIAMRRM